MSDFQKEAAVAAVLCFFLCACLCFAAIVHTEQAEAKRTIKRSLIQNDMDTENTSF